MLGVRAWMPAGPGGRPINFRIAIAVAIFFALSAAVLALREDTIPPDDARSAWIFAACLLTGALFAFAASRFLGNEADAIRAVFFLGVSELVVALFAFWQAYHLFIDDGYERVGSTLMNPNFLGSYMNICAVTLLSARKVVDQLRWRVFLWIAACFGAIALLLTISRAGILAFFVSLLLLWATAPGQLRRKRIALATLSAVALTLLLGMALRTYRAEFSTRDMDERQQALTEAAQNMEDYARYEAATYALKEWSQHPLVGIGFGAFQAVNYQNNGIYANTHDTFLQLLVGTGLIGVVLAGYVIGQLWKGLSVNGKALFIPIVGCFAVNSLFADFLAQIEMLVALTIAYLLFKRQSVKPVS